MANIATYDFPSHYKGDSFLPVSIQFSGMDLTNVIIKMDFREIPAINTTPVFFWSTEDGSIIIDDAPNGKMIMGQKIIDVNAGTYQYDTQLIFPDTRVQTMFKGTIKINQDVTE